MPFCAWTVGAWCHINYCMGGLFVFICVKPRIYPALAVKNAKTSFAFLARLCSFAVNREYILYSL